MNAALLDEAMTAQLSLEWERFKKALSQAGDIGSLHLDDWRISVERDRRAIPPALSVALCESGTTPQLRGDSRRHSSSGVRNARNNAALHKAEIAVPSHKAAEIE